MDSQFDFSRIVESWKNGQPKRVRRIDRTIQHGAYLHVSPCGEVFEGWGDMMDHILACEKCQKELAKS